MQRPRGEREPAMSGRSQEVQHDWSGKCQGVAQAGWKARWAQRLGAFQVASA